jgi:nitrate reductase / nitrite oxidoreductase, beta subunit
VGVRGFVEGEGSEADPDDVFPAIDELRIPIQYLVHDQATSRGMDR